MKVSKAFAAAIAKLFNSPEAQAERELAEWNAKPTRQSQRRAAFKADKRVRNLIERQQRLYH